MSKGRAKIRSWRPPEVLAVYRLYIIENRTIDETVEVLGNANVNQVRGLIKQQGWVKTSEMKHVNWRAGSVRTSTKRKSKPLPPHAQPGPKSAVLADLPMRHACRWPVGALPPEGQMARQLMCGEAVSAADWQVTNYCPCHRHLAHGVD